MKPLTSHDVPQANRPERVVELVLAVVAGKELSSAGLGLHQRDVRYYAHAGFLLGFLDRDGQASASGEALAELPEAARLRRTAQAFAESRVGRRWIRWAKVSALPEVDAASAEEFLLACSELAESTASRRAATLRQWWVTLAPHLPGELRTPSKPPPPSSPPPPIDTSAMTDLPQKGRDLFARAAVDLPAADWARLREEIQQHLDEFRDAAKHNELLPVDIAEELAAALDRLLELAPSLSAEQRRLVVGAARYFVSDDDARPDLEGVLGLDDDVLVFNWVVGELGLGDMMLDV